MDFRLRFLAGGLLLAVTLRAASPFAGSPFGPAVAASQATGTRERARGNQVAVIDSG